MEQALSNIRVLDLGGYVTGPYCSKLLGAMGAEVIKVERAPDGDDTRRLIGFGSGFFPFFNRNKKSITIDLKSEKGKAVLRKLVRSADVFIENFAPGTVDRLGFGYDEVSRINPRLIYCSLKGFMKGPYENRPALDEVVQMMSGLAYGTTAMFSIHPKVRTDRIMEPGMIYAASSIMGVMASPGLQIMTENQTIAVCMAIAVLRV